MLQKFLIIAREISYRHKIVKLAVLVESTYGLGEALVSDLATPAYYEILIHSNENGEIRLKIIEKKVKALSDEYDLQIDTQFSISSIWKEIIYGPNRKVPSGLYEGKVRIMEDSMHSEREPGEIVICIGTDSAWASPFPLVGALVLEMGGMLQYDAIVSREYGLPAVVGVANAKKLFQNSHLIHVNGSIGHIQILPD
ncbi:unnamed protein product [Rotaria socialis]|uniref:PEP-utilising enzyme mobile domain-containing protein n=2 Tax=Rotaria socialis TaxID=392032 RepID=A0A818RYL9_9BILA|nr:unnamed protein product [Rotaria socialis]CAF3655810.1 unnamed protein product [Rotaria socialis]CAF4318660.1 unnamed protein product [Rotaria socialis]CAF4642809.1 unnamed protein product [Rotaria socialis]